MSPAGPDPMQSASTLLTQTMTAALSTGQHNPVESGSGKATGSPGKGDMCPLLAAEHPPFNSVSMRLFWG